MPQVFEKEVHLSMSEDLKAKMLEKKYKVKFICEDDNNFEIQATSDDNYDNYLYHFRMSDYVNMEGKDFIEKVKNFKLLLETIKTGFTKKKIVLWREYETLKITIYYMIIYEVKKISFELHPQLTHEQEKELIGKYYEDSEKIMETKNNNDYRAEIVKYDKQFIDYGDRDIIKVTIENKGTCSWPRFESSLKCVPEFSTLLCEDYVFDNDDVQPGEQVEVELEFLKNEEDNLEPPYFTFLHLHIHPENFDPMLILDFGDAFKNEKIMATEEEIDKYTQTKITKITNKKEYRKTIITTKIKKGTNQKNQNNNNFLGKGSKVFFNSNDPHQKKNNKMNQNNMMMNNNMNNQNNMMMNNMNNMNNMNMNNMPNNYNMQQMNNNYYNNNYNNNYNNYNNMPPMNNNMPMMNNNMPPMNNNMPMMNNNMPPTNNNMPQMNNNMPPMNNNMPPMNNSYNNNMH